ncbi:GNAT family N-acetyltransferase [Vibrio algarum]|uniref:GNAT family N-acetyltransferase n=1 Tax=Vibrio algarum TaxID=3020714 RepID=A0ABT4YWS3_9VIBR|nr:GNAT family N-acetyltransferase [Vibrio sp. KJ40-1]MDB1125835.1 GNAT family N-acetyltransferase [Vibrio sp. KJ40-1]
MIKLRKMRDDEFSAYRQYSMLAYGSDLAENYGYTLNEAADIADNKLTECFPDGIETSDHEMYCIEFGVESAAQLVGYLWYKVAEPDKTAFIYDFYVFEGFRGCGIGTQVFSKLESRLKARGVEFLNLRVASNNERAKKLYQKLAFNVTGYNMTKKID